MQATDQKHRGEFLFAVLLLLLLSLAPLHAQPVATNRVLELDGNGSYVELPPNIFNDLTEATIEAWVRWDSFGHFNSPWSFSGAAEPPRQMAINNFMESPTLRFFIYDRQAKSYRDSITVEVPGILSQHQWIHLAAASGPGGMRLYVNGMLAGQTAYAGSFAAIEGGSVNRLGKDHFPENQSFNGQMAEVRVRKVARNQQQVFTNMFSKLTGQEPDLAGLWNFNDGTAKDSSPAGHHGKLVGQARVTEATLPASDALVPWSRLAGKVIDGQGNAPLPLN